MGGGCGRRDTGSGERERLARRGVREFWGGSRMAREGRRVGRWEGGVAHGMGGGEGGLRVARGWFGGSGGGGGGWMGTVGWC